VNKAVVRSRGPGGVRLQNVADTLDAELHGSGGLAASMSGKRLLLKLDGPGDARIDGSVAQVSAQISGSGSLEGRRLSVGQTDISVRGPGSATVNVVGKDGKGRTDLLVDRSGSHPMAN
jgi:Putative auto-transporter adhesin, head GIN domain